MGKGVHRLENRLLEEVPADGCMQYGGIQVQNYFINWADSRAQ